MKRNKKWIFISVAFFYMFMTFFYYTVYSKTLIKSIPDINVTVKHNEKYQLPLYVTAIFNNGKKKSVPVTWNSNIVDTSKVSKLTFIGKVKNYNKTVKAVINIVPKIIKVDDIIKIAVVGEKIEFPSKVKAYMSDGTIKDVSIKFNYSLPPTNKEGIYICDKGIAPDYNAFVKLKWIIRRYPDVSLKYITEKVELNNVFNSFLIENLKGLDYKPLDEREIKRLDDIIKNELAKYPKEILMANLDSISFFKELCYEGIVVGGTSDSRMNIYMCDDNYNSKDLKTIFHHEFNHILFYNNRELFDEKGWISANEENFKYKSTGTEAIKEGNNSMDFSSELAKKGFINQYSMSAIEEDIAEISSYLFINDKDFWNLVDNSPRLKKKVDILIDFYSKLNPKLNEKYFKNL